MSLFNFKQLLKNLLENKRLPKDLSGYEWVWENSSNYSYKNTSQKGFKALTEKINHNSSDSNVEKYRLKHKKYRKLTFVFAYAALFLMFLSASIYFYYSNKNVDSVEYLNNGSVAKKITLIDGTIVVLNSKSKLVTNKEFGYKHRNFVLNGEAFFDVKPNKELPDFQIKNNQNLTVKVLGTSFNLNFYSKSKSTVSVVSGKVKVLHKDKLISKLEKGSSISVYSNGKALLGGFDSNEELSWLDNQLFFREESLGNIAERFSQVYKHSLVYPKELMETKITTTLPMDNMEHAILILQETLNNYSIRAIPLNSK
jgi:ferric-dicitrate binding protein FerR (iron transport regulator)